MKEHSEGNHTLKLTLPKPRSRRRSREQILIDKIQAKIDAGTIEQSYMTVTAIQPIEGGRARMTILFSDEAATGLLKDRFGKVFSPDNVELNVMNGSLRLEWIGSTLIGQCNLSQKALQHLSEDEPPTQTTSWAKRSRQKRTNPSKDTDPNRSA